MSTYNNSNNNPEVKTKTNEALLKLYTSFYAAVDGGSVPLTLNLEQGKALVDNRSILKRGKELQQVIFSRSRFLN